MNKEMLSKMLGLTCVENYFLAYCSKFFDERKLFVKSYLPFNEVMDNFIIGNAKYENYPIEKIQDISFELGCSIKRTDNKVVAYENCLNLIKVNKKFFEGVSLAPWRPDHYISINKSGDGYDYINNYPLSSGMLNEKTMNEVFDDFSLSYKFVGEMNEELYEKMHNSQLHNLHKGDVESVQLNVSNINKIKNALLVLRISRERVAEWLAISDKNELSAMLKDEATMCHKLAMGIEVMCLRNKINLDSLQAKLNEIINIEKLIQNKAKELVTLWMH